MLQKSPKGGFDLHTHSSFSDGTTTPSEIAILAKNIGLAGFALTDHDTIEGWDEARSEASKQKIDFLPGIELTTDEKNRSMHLLAYGTSPTDARLLENLAFLRDARLIRSKEMISRLSKDFKLDWDAVLAPVYSGELKSVGRPHLADALVEAGYFVDRSAAFEDALSPRGPYYVPTKYLSTTEAIEIVRDAGGFTVLAHPAAFRMRKPIDTDLVAFLAQHGLGGIELNHPENKAEWLPPLHRAALEHGLLVTGASDFHGAGKPNKLGEQSSSLDVVEKIRDRVVLPN